MNLDDVTLAKERISPYLKPTPVLRAEKLEHLLDYKGSIFLKLENEQPTGSFKVRGAFNALLNLRPEIDKVVTFSLGNFAQAVSYGSMKLHKKATIVMPKGAPKTKVEGTKRWGADVVFCNGDGEKVVQELAHKEGFFPLHPFNDINTIEGQGTLALELLEAKVPMDHFFCPVGGGGLLSGCGPVLKGLNPNIITYAVEPTGGNDFYLSFQAKKHLALGRVDTIADGLRAKSVGNLNYPLLMSSVDRAIFIPDDDIIASMKLLWEFYQMVTEPSGAAALAGFISLHKGLKGDVVILITGKNVDEDAFNKWVK